MAKRMRTGGRGLNLWAVGAASAALAVTAFGAGRLSAEKTAAELEKEKAMQSPYPNDLGPEKIDDIVKAYPKDVQQGYKMMLAKCSRCHTSARPLHSRFVEPNAEKDQREAAVEEMKKSHPEMFKGDFVWEIDANIWQRYVKRMKAKPGCDLSDAEAKLIWKFLVHDSNERKLGKNSEAWAAHRKKLIAEFKTKYPKRYEELEKAKDL